MHTATFRQLDLALNRALHPFRHAPPPSAHSSPEVHHARRTPDANREGDCPGTFFAGV
jgi:hypothetical protein